MTSLLYGKPIHAHLHIERIPVEKVPEDEAEAATWMHDLFVVKVITIHPIGNRNILFPVSNELNTNSYKIF